MVKVDLAVAKLKKDTDVARDNLMGASQTICMRVNCFMEVDILAQKVRAMCLLVIGIETIIKQG